jgi:hypothetical protein
MPRPAKGRLPGGYIVVSAPAGLKDAHLVDLICQPLLAGRIECRGELSCKDRPCSA